MNVVPIAIDLPGDLGMPGGSAPEPAAGPSVDIAHLTGPQKAAIVVRLMAGSGARLSLRNMPESLQAELVRQVGALSPMPEETIRAVAEEFAGLVEVSAAFGPGGVTHALDLLGGSVSDSVAQRLRQQTGFGDDQDPWDRIADKDSDDLLPVLEQESVEVAGVILSKLGVSKAAELLGLMPGDRARRITYAISLTSGIQPGTVRRIGIALAGALSIEPVRAFADGPVERVGAILNTSRSSTRDEVLGGLDEEDAAFAEEVRRAIFTFANIADRVAPGDVPKIIRGIEQDVLVRALTAATGDLERSVEHILGAISKRMAETLREEMGELGTVDEDAGEEAMGALIAEIRRLEAEGEIHLVAKEE